jgi:hypothetical protein
MADQKGMVLEFNLKFDKIIGACERIV